MGLFARLICESDRDGRDASSPAAAVVSARPAAVPPQGHSRTMKISRIASLFGLLVPTLAFANEANLVLPDLSTQKFFGDSIDGRLLLIIGIVVAAIGLVFSFVQFVSLKNMRVHKSML